jgi:hypothetical protein
MNTIKAKGGVVNKKRAGRECACYIQRNKYLHILNKT